MCFSYLFNPSVCYLLRGKFNKNINTPPKIFTVCWSKEQHEYSRCCTATSCFTPWQLEPHLFKQRVLKHSPVSNSVCFCVHNTVCMCVHLWRIPTQGSVCCPSEMWVIWEPKPTVQCALRRSTYFISPLIPVPIRCDDLQYKQWHNAAVFMDLLYSITFRFLCNYATNLSLGSHNIMQLLCI